MLDHLLSPLTIAGMSLRNRIVSTGHHTYLADKVPGDELIAYHEARARGGVGLIVSEIVAVHETAAFSPRLLNALTPDCIPHYARLTQAVQQHDTRIVAQLFHPGREILSSPDGFSPLAWAPSAVPNERFHILPKALPCELIEDIIEGYLSSAERLAEAGFDGVEIVASHGYLPAQFLNPLSNQRDDDWGGDFDARLRFLRRILAGLRARADGLVIGVRLSADELDSQGVDADTMADVCAALGPEVDYLSLVAGSSAWLGSSVHITPPMGVNAAYITEHTSHIRARYEGPLIVTGRINQPQDADAVIARGEADLCGMTRALICDPEMPEKAVQGALDDIRACIGCNQACIGHAHKGLPVSCIQYPESGRETVLQAGKSRRSRKVLVVGGGPAGMKAAVVAARRGHSVNLHERESQFGGQVRWGAMLPGREEFGGLATNLKREVDTSGVALWTQSELSVEDIIAQEADTVILATGATPYVPVLQVDEGFPVFSAHDLLSREPSLANSVVVADWKADWVGIGIAERLARHGHAVSLYANAALIGESLQVYTRNHYLGRLLKLGVQLHTHARLFGADGDTVFFEHTVTGEPILAEAVGALVLAAGSLPFNPLEAGLRAQGIDVCCIGDCLLPRTAEEAVYEGLLAATGID